MAAGLIPGLLGSALLWWWWSMMRFKRTVENVPTSKVKGVFIGLNEVSGTVIHDHPLITHLAEVESVWYSWSVEEHWRKKVSYTDAKGNRKTRTETGWTSLDSGGEYVNFHLQDSTGELLVDPGGAKMDVRSVMRHQCGRSDPMYYEKGPSGSIANSTHRRRFSEEALTPDERIYVLGPARLREDVVAPMIAKDPGERYFYISVRSEKQITRRAGIGAVLVLIVAAACGLAVPVVALMVGRGIEVEAAFTHHPGAMFLGGLGFLMAWGLLYLQLLYNGLVRNRNRLKRALSLIDVQLKRRHDLVPSLVATVKGAAQHEAEVQEAVAAARSMASRRSGVANAGRNLDAGRPAVSRLLAVAEAYPDLKTDANFAKLFDELKDTEDRIALAREFYNDSLKTLRDRLQTFPDLLVAKVFRFKAGRYLPAVHEEPEIRTPPDVS